MNRFNNDKKKGRSSGDVDVVAQALSELSVEERSKVYSEMHGVADPIEETPEFVEQCLHEMEVSLKELKGKKSLPTAAIKLAESLSLEYVNDPDFRMQFFRISDFNIPVAAECMIRYFEFKFMTFGGSKLCKKITYDDLEPEDVVALKKGFFQILPVRDHSGRLVTIFFPSEQEYSSPHSFVRNLFYLFACLFSFSGR